TLLDARRAGHLPLNSNYALPSPAAMARRFAERPDAIAATLAIAERCQVSLDFSAQRLPVFVFEEEALTQRRRGAENDGRGGEGERGRRGERETGRQSPISNLQSPISPFSYLYELCHANLPKRYPDLRPAVLKQLAHEL